jgi:AraC-like DNA-binding protein
MMRPMTSNTSERQAGRMQADREELSERIALVLPRDGSAEPQPGLIFNRASSRSGPIHGAMDPAFCVIAQGSKEIAFGGHRLRYDPAHYLVTTVGMPGIGQIVEASPSHPYLAVRLVLDPATVTSAMVESGLAHPRGDGGVKAANVSPLDAGLLDAMLRLVRLIDTPDKYRVLAPLIAREIVYLLLTGEQAGRMHHLATFGGHAHRMVRAVKRLSENFEKPMRMEDVAREVGMSASAFHAHFRAVTGMSPLQFQKHLRLQEARRLMLNEGLDVGEAGYRVGYEDRSQFSREYKRHFGEPPMRDVERLRELATA